MKSDERYSNKDPLGVLIIFALTGLSSIWIGSGEFRPFHAIAAILALLTVGLYYVRVVKLPLEVRAPLGDSLIVLAGIDIFIYFFNKFIEISEFDRFTKQFTPGIGFILLFAGVTTKLFLLDEALKEIVEKSAFSMRALGNWIREDLRNFIRTVLLILGITALVFQEDLDHSFDGKYAGLLSLTSFSWPERKWRRIRFIFAVLGLWIIYLSVENVYNVSKLGSMLLGITLIAWSISLPSLVRIVKMTSLSLYNLILNVLMTVKKVFISIFDTLRNNPVFYIRVGLAISGVFLLIYELFSREKNPILIVSGFILLLPLALPAIIRFGRRSFGFLHGLVLRFFEFISKMIKDIVKWIKHNKLLSLRVLSFIVGFLMVVYAPRDKVDLATTSIKLNLLSGFIFILLSFLPTLLIWAKAASIWLYQGAIRFYLFLTSLYKVLKHRLSSLIKWISENQILSLRLSSALIGSLFYFTAPSENDINLIGTAFFFFLAALPSLITAIKYFAPPIYNMLKVLKRYFSNDQTMRLVILILATLFLSFGFDFMIMKIIDHIVYLILLILTALVDFIKFIYSKITVNSLISTFAWLVFSLSLVFNILFSEIGYSRSISFMLFIASIVIWHLAYDYRRKRFYRFVHWATFGIIKMIDSLIKTTWKLVVLSFRRIIRNILIIIAWLIAFILFYLSLGLLLPGYENFVSELFPGITKDRLVSGIVGITLALIGILSIQQSIVRRELLQIKEEGKKLV
ncbi:MAG: hypothetical protein ACXAD7_07190, partial [Candidatus Kariarchaeaceae archaeon]